MILSEEVQIKTTGLIIKYYKSLGYDAEHGKTITVKISDLTRSSESIVDVCCDICKSNSRISFARYNKSVSKLGIYSCNKCKNFKSRITCLDRYGVENPSQIIEVKEKKELTCMSNYGVRNPSHSSEIKDRIRNKFLEKYGVEYVFQNDEIRKKFEETMVDRYGVKHALLNSDLKEKSKKTLQMNYGVNHPSHSEEIQEKSKLTRIERFFQIPEDRMSGWEKYKSKVKRETRKNKKKLLEMWDGYDFYDGEYIMDNFIKYKPRQKKYPSIDHKISVFIGFINNIPHNIIGSLENICLTKTEINCSKREKSYLEFLK